MNNDEIIDTDLEISEQTGIMTLKDNELITIAETIDRRIEAVLTIKRAALKVTNSQDWCDQSGKPYLEISGSEKIRGLFGVSWKIETPIETNDPDGHFAYSYMGIFTFAGSSIEMVGTRSSKDKFFNRYKYNGASGDKILLPPSEIDKGKVKKAAYTNCIGRGVKAILGLNNLTWEDLKDTGIVQGSTNSVDYKQQEMSTEGKNTKTESHNMMEAMYGNQYHDELLRITSFTTKEGKTIAGKRALSGLSEKALSVTYGKIKKEFEEWGKNKK